MFFRVGILLKRTTRLFQNPVDSTIHISMYLMYGEYKSSTVPACDNKQS